MKSHSGQRFWILPAIAVAGLLGLPALAMAEIVVGRAKAVQASLPHATVVLVDTGPLFGADAVQASAIAGNSALSIDSRMSADTLHATAIGDRSRVDSEASLGGLNASVAGNTIAAAFVMARASKITGVAGTGTSEIDGLSVNGVPVGMSGAPNQTVPVAGGVLILNEQRTGAGGALVNAIHLRITGGPGVVIGSAAAGTPPR